MFLYCGTSCISRSNISSETILNCVIPVSSFVSLLVLDIGNIGVIGSKNQGITESWKQGIKEARNQGIMESRNQAITEEVDGDVS